MSAISVVMMTLVIVLLGAVLFYQIRLIKKISRLEKQNGGGVIDKDTQNKAVLTAVIAAAITQYKIQNSQRQ